MGGDYIHRKREYNPNPITEITKALVCQMDAEGYKVIQIAKILDRKPAQVGYLLNKLKNSGEYEYYVKLKNASVSCAEGKNSDKESIVHRFYDKCSEEM